MQSLIHCLRNTLLLFIGVIWFSALLISCASTPKPYSGRQSSGTWEVKAQAKDLVTNKSYNISMDIVTMTPSSLRMDVTGTLGINLATLVLSGNQVRYALYRQKKYYEGQSSDKALLPIFKINLNPILLMNICTDSPIEDSGWNCQMGPGRVVESCQRKFSDGNLIKIVWSDRDGDKKRVTISDKSFELQMVFKSYTALDRTKVESSKSPFQFETPKDFTRYKIP